MTKSRVLQVRVTDAELRDLHFRSIAANKTVTALVRSILFAPAPLVLASDLPPKREYEREYVCASCAKAGFVRWNCRDCHQVLGGEG